jgi:hypothetical protein
VGTGDNWQEIGKEEKAIEMSKEAKRILLRRVPSTPNQEHERVGDTWVYAYDLPYRLDEAKVAALLKRIAEEYG